MAKSLSQSAVKQAVTPAPGFAQQVAPEGGLLKGTADIDFDTTIDIAYSSPQHAVAPRADLPGPWFITNLGPNTLYYGPSGVTSGTGTSVTSGSKSAAIPVSTVTTFVVCASGQTTVFKITNS